MVKKHDLTVLDKFSFERPPVGVKFLPVKPKGFKRPEKQHDFCELLAEAQKGNAFYATKDDITCLGPLLLGMVDSDQLFESGQVGPPLGVFKDPRANRRIYQHLPRMARNSVKYVAIAPLDKLTFEPDLLIILSNAQQAEIFLRAKSYTTGEPWQAKATMVAGCAWLYIYPMVTGEVNMTVTGLGFGMKSRRLFPEGQILLSIPFDKLPQIIKNLEEMEWVPESFTLGPEGHKKKVKRIVAELQKEE